MRSAFAFGLLPLSLVASRPVAAGFDFAPYPSLLDRYLVPHRTLHGIPVDVLDDWTANDLKWVESR